MKGLTAWEVRKRLPFCKWKVVRNDFETYIEAHEFEFKESSKLLGYFYQWQVRGYGNENN